jgi:phage gp46-like protein
MSDIRIVSKADLKQTVADWLLLPNGTLDETEELANIVKVALMTDRMSDPGEILPDPDSTDRRGWWGDLEAAEIWGGWKIGCKNWLLSRAKITGQASSEGATLLRAYQYTQEAVQALVNYRYASYVEVQVVRSELSRIDVLVTIYRGPLDALELRFQGLWQEMTGG